MAYLEELLSEFRKGAKIRRKDWKKEHYLYYNCEDIWNEDNKLVSFSGEDLICDSWELYQETIDWDYIVKNKCLCWFWDGKKYNNAYIGYLANSYNKKYYSFRSREGVRWNHCRPVRRDEIMFYEDKKNEI